MKFSRKTLDTFRLAFGGLSCIICSYISLGVSYIFHGLLQEFSPFAKTLQELSHTVQGQSPELVGPIFRKALPWAAGVGRRLAKGPAHTRASLSRRASKRERTARKPRSGRTPML